MRLLDGEVLQEREHALLPGDLGDQAQQQHTAQQPHDPVVLRLGSLKICVNSIYRYIKLLLIGYAIAKSGRANH